MKTFKIIGICIAVFLGIWVLTFSGIFMGHVNRSAENAVVSYDEYWDIYHTCEKINADLGVMESTPDSDAQFAQFSKAQRVNAMKQQMNRWVNEYNAKSNHIDKKWWKSDKLPYALSVNDFPNYNK